VDVFLANEQELAVDEGALTALAAHALESEDLDDDSELSVLLIGADHMRELNFRFAGNNYATDVLAFPMMEDEDQPQVLGDVVICPEVARANARKVNHPLEEELGILLVHGILHLLGYEHSEPEDKAQMDQRLREVLDSFDGSLV
jgi:probable rRNA maturation factor